MAPIGAIGVPRGWGNIINLPAKAGPMTPNIATILRQHVSREVRCLDRLSLQAYMPKLQTPGGRCYFLHDYLGNPIPSPALLQPRHDAFIAAVDRCAGQHHVPLIPDLLTWATKILVSTGSVGLMRIGRPHWRV